MDLPLFLESALFRSRFFLPRCVAFEKSSLGKASPGRIRYWLQTAGAPLLSTMVSVLVSSRVPVSSWVAMEGRAIQRQRQGRGGAPGPARRGGDGMSGHFLKRSSWTSSLVPDISAEIRDRVREELELHEY